ncbi:heme oxygenase-like protein [Hysterangium stoloniferum]|nr:heme oxygenase-like protein [Hysterangium stoloniferum]
MNGVDLSEEVSDLLRKETRAAHKNADNTEAAVSLARGDLDKDEYIRYLIILWHVYSTLENALEVHSSHPVLAPTYNPAVLARTPALSSDIVYLLYTPESEWQRHPLALSISQNIPAVLLEYTDRIRTAATSHDPSTLLAHLYVRYLGDLGGGQQISHRIAKAYGLDDTTGLGTQFYQFKKLGGSSPATTRGDMTTIKDWFCKAAIVSETNTVFSLNDGFLRLLRPPSQTKVTAKEGSFTVAAVLSFMLAMGIAHFEFVTNWFLWDYGLEELHLVRAWVASTFGISI